MAIAETAKMVAELDLKTQKFTKGVSNAVGSVGKLSSAVAKSRAVAVGLGVGLERVAEFGLRQLGDAIGNGIEQVQILEKANQQTAAAIESTGSAAGQTVESIRAQAQALEDLTTADDKVIQQGENLLLTFTGIGKSVFPDATKAMVNMAIALNKGDAATADFDGTAIKLGKALNDPVKGLTALTKAGVVFSAAQADQIKKLAGQGNALKDLQAAHVGLDKKQKAFIKDLGGSVGPLTAARKAGVKLTKSQEAMLKTMEDGSGKIAAQRIILAELEKEFGKAGEAAGTGFTADVNRAQDAIDDAEAALAQGLIPAVGEVAKELAKTFRDPQVLDGLRELGRGIGDVIKGGVAFAKTVPWGTIASSLKTAAGFAKDLLNAFLGLPTWVQTAVITGWGLNKLSGGALTGLIGELGKGLIKGVLGITAAQVNITAANVTGGGIGGGPGTTATGPLGGLQGAIKDILPLIPIAGIVAAVTKELTTQTNSIFNQAGRPSVENPLSFNPLDSLTNIKNAIETLIGVARGEKTELQSVTQSLRDAATSADIADLIAATKGENIQKAAAQRDKETSASVNPAVAKAQADTAAKLAAIAKNIQSAAATRDKETSDSISAIVNATAPLAVSSDIKNLQAANIGGFSDIDRTVASAKSAVDLTTGAARNAGIAAARQTFSSGNSIEQTIRANRPIIDVTVNISATTVRDTVTVSDRAGSRTGSRDGDGGGGPGQ